MPMLRIVAGEAGCCAERSMSPADIRFFDALLPRAMLSRSEARSQARLDSAHLVETSRGFRRARTSHHCRSARNGLSRPSGVHQPPRRAYAGVDHVGLLERAAGDGEGMRDKAVRVFDGVFQPRPPTCPFASSRRAKKLTVAGQSALPLRFRSDA
jgi:hypothetical protein